jgi:8-oxo-dGTP pyrophosphatase MutT (NUDIX family)
MKSNLPENTRSGHMEESDYHPSGECRHLFASNSSGCGTGRVEVWCVRCGAQEIFYDDTGTVLYSELDPCFDNSHYTGIIHTKEELNESILHSHFCERFADERQICLVCGKQLGQEEQKNPDQTKAASAEKLYIVEKSRRGYIIRGFEERTVAESKGLQHLTVIIVPFVADGPEKGRWIVHDRTAKLWAKGKAGKRSPSLNLFGGHCAAAEDQEQRVNEPVTMDIFEDAAKRELEEELLCRGSGRCLEVWSSKEGPSGSIEAAQYAHLALIPLGIVTCSEKDNKEASFLYALPVPSKDVDALIAADNYLRQGKECDISLPILRKSEAELKALYKQNPDVEICDAITRLWRWENRVVHRKLQRVIRSRCKTGNAHRM